MLQFKGIVGSRSSRGGAPRGPVGEAEILALNPKRRAAILAATGWNDVFPGTLNLEVEPVVVEHLLSCTPLIREKGEDVKYPDPYAHIPGLRIGYLYYAALIRNGDKSASVLIRRAVNPLRGRVEAFADRNLRDLLGLSDGDWVLCEVNQQVV
jgi:CTP-dependent riboflavin kinase